MWFFARVCIWVLLCVFIAFNMRFEIQLRLASFYKKQLINCLPIFCNKGCTTLSHCLFNPHFFYMGCYVEMGETFCSRTAVNYSNPFLQCLTWFFWSCSRNLLNLVKRAIFMQTYFLGTWTYFEKFFLAFKQKYQLIFITMGFSLLENSSSQIFWTHPVSIHERNAD